MNRREFNKKIAKGFVYAVVIFSGIKIFEERKLADFKSSCPREYYCINRCPFSAISLDLEGYPQIIKSKCVAWVEETKKFKWKKCGLCLKGCPTRVLELLNEAKVQEERTI